jgi:hypothetical protein
MKKAISIFLCFQVITWNSFATEVMKLPFLVQHYIEHEKFEHPDLRFSSFLYEHYVEDNHKDESVGHCDEKMPFKHCHDCCSHIVTGVIGLISENSIMIIFSTSTKEMKFPSDENLKSYYHCCIWQPPKIV